MTTILNSTSLKLWKMTHNRFRILVFSGLCFAVMC